MEGQGWETVIACSGQEALALLRINHFDLLVLDDYLSDADGIQVLETLRSCAIHVNVVLTYHRQPGLEQSVRLRELGVSAFARKTSSSEITQAVHHLLTASCQ